MNKIGHYNSMTVAGSFIFCSGQVGLDKDTGHIVAGVRKQTELAINSIESLLFSRGLDLASIVKVNVYLTRDDDFDEMNEMYKMKFGVNLPARTTVVVKSLPKASSEGPEPILVEIDAIACH